MRAIGDRLARLEAMSAPAAEMVVAVVECDETPEQAIARETASREVNKETLVVAVRLFGTTRAEYLRRTGG